MTIENINMIHCMVLHRKKNLSEGCNKELIYFLSVNSIKNEKQITNLIIKRLKVRSNSH
jgi:hypothetical protein